jgi:hypothetical protein
VKNCRPSASLYKGDGDSKEDLRSLVTEYRKEHAPKAAEESAMFRRMPSLGLAIHHAALAIDEQEKCFDHQALIIPSARQKAKEILTRESARLDAVRSFDELHVLVDELLSPVRGIGELYIYDAALRLGAYLRLLPERVYLHRGTRDGARALGLDVSRPYLEIHETPAALQTLSADAIESFSCIFRNRFPV